MEYSTFRPFLVWVASLGRRVSSKNSRSAVDTGLTGWFCSQRRYAAFLSILMLVNFIISCVLLFLIVDLEILVQYIGTQ